MKKRLLAMLLCVAMVASLLTVGAAAEDEIDSGVLSDNISYAVNILEGTLTISGSGAIPYPLDTMNLPYADYMDYISTIIIDDGVTNYSSDLIPWGYFSRNIVKEVVLGADVQDGLYGLASLHSLVSISVSNENEKFFSSDGVLYELLDDGTYNLYVYPFNKSDKTYTVIDGTSVISGGFGSGFNDNDYIATVILPDSIKSIEGNAFAECALLTSVNIPDGVESISATAFWYCYSLSEIHIPASVTSLKGYILGDWIASQEMVSTSVYFYGDAPADFDGTITSSHVRNGFHMTIYYPDGASGWQEKIDNYYAEFNSGTDDNDVLADYVEFVPWNPGQFPDTPSTPLELISTYPANGEVVDISANELVLTFNRDLDINPNWLNRSIYIKDYETDEIVKEFDDVQYASNSGFISGSTMTIRYGLVGLDVGKTYYVEIDPNVILGEQWIDGSWDYFDGLEKGEWVFYTEEANTFTLGKDNNSFSHNRRDGGGFEGTENYQFRNDEILEYLTLGMNWYEQLMLLWNCRRPWGGACYGIASTIALVYNEQYELSEISNSDAQTYFALPNPCDDDKLYDAINFYQITQELRYYSAYEIYPETNKVLPTLIDLLSENPGKAYLLAYGSSTESYGHTILALGYKQDSNGDYIVQLYDENCIRSNEPIIGKFIEMKISNDLSSFEFEGARGEPINNDTCSWMGVVETAKLPSLPGSFTHYYSSSNFSSNNSNAGLIISVDLADGTILYTAEGKTLFADEMGLPSGTVKIISAEPFLVGPYTESNRWIITIEPTEELTIKTASGKVDAFLSFEDSTMAIAGKSLADARLVIGDSVEVESIKGQTASAEVAFGSSKFGTALINIAADVDQKGLFNIDDIEGNAVVTVSGFSSEPTAKRVSISGDTNLNCFISGSTATIYDYYGDSQNPNVPSYNLPSEDNVDNPDEMQLPFTDVAANQWFYNAVAYVYTNGMMEGVGDTVFNPDGSMTRAMVWAILARIDGEPVTGESWIETARAWAMSEGVSDGTDATGLVTREQFATMLWRYAGEPASDFSLGAYTDAFGVSDYALDAMRWAVENGIITGVSATTIDPQGTATRAQAAAMLMRFIENIG